MRQQLAITDPLEMLGAISEEPLGFRHAALLQKHVAHVEAELSGHADITECLEDAQTLLGVGERPRVLAGLLKGEGEPLVDAGQRRHVEDLRGRGDRGFIGGDRFDRLSRHVVQVGPMAEHARLQDGVGDARRLVALQRAVEPLTGGVRPPQEVVDAAQAVVQLDQELMPLQTLRGDDRLLQDRLGFLWPPLLHQSDGERQLGARPQLDRDRPRQHPRDQRFGARPLAMEQTHFGFREGKLERGGGVSRLFEEVIDWALQAAGDDPQVLCRGLGAT